MKNIEQDEKQIEEMLDEVSETNQSIIKDLKSIKSTSQKIEQMLVEGRIENERLSREIKKDKLNKIDAIDAILIGWIVAIWFLFILTALA